MLLFSLDNVSAALTAIALRPGSTDHGRVSYFTATRHPWPCFLFLLPLLTAYEGGVLWAGGSQPETLRNGADAWPLGPGGVWSASTLLGAGPADRLLSAVELAAARGPSGRRHRRLAGHGDRERGLRPGPVGPQSRPGADADSLGIELNLSDADKGAGAGGDVHGGRHLRGNAVPPVAVFRTGRRPASGPDAAVPGPAAGGAAVGDDVCGGHHVGPYGEEFDDFIFLFRTLAGLFFAFLYQFRGFGVAVGMAHACYDVLVGIAVG